MKKLYFYLFYLSVYSIWSQSINLDSTLKEIIKLGSVEGTLKLIKLGYSLKLENSQRAIELIDSAKVIAINKKQEKNIAAANICLGDVYRILGDHEKAMKLELEGLRIAEKINDTLALAFALNNIGTIYQNQNKYDLAISFYKKSLIEKVKLNDPNKLIPNYVNIGLSYFQLNKLDSSEKYLKGSLALSKNNPYFYSAALINYSALIEKKKDYVIALKLLDTAINLKIKINDPEGHAIALQTKAEILSRQSMYQECLKINIEALNISKQNNYKTLELTLYKSIYECYLKLGDFKEAFKNLMIHTKLNDSLNSIEKIKEIEKLNKVYLTEKKDLALQKATSELNLNKVKDKQKTTVILLVTLALLVSLALSFVALSNYKKAKKSKDQIQLQKRILEENQEQILGSIRYAKRIQAAQLPSDKRVENLLNRTKDEK